MPPLDSYVARIDSNSDISQRQFVAVIEKLPHADILILKVKSKAGTTVYEQILNSMIASWHLAVDKLVFQ